MLALFSETAAPLLRLWARIKTGPASPPAEWRKALIVGDNHIGDLLYRSASLAHLKAGLPRCEFHYLAAPGSSAILEGNPAITRILPWLRSDSPFDLSPEHLAELRRMRFDAVLCTNCTRYWPELLLAVRLGVPNRVAYTYKGFSGLTTVRIPIRHPQPFAAYFRDYVATLTGVNPGWSARPVIFTSDQEEQEAAALWQDLNLAQHPHVTACFMTSRQPTGLWPVAKFGESLRLLRAKRRTHILLCGSPSDEAVLRQVNDEFGLNADILAGRISIRALCALLRRCTVVFTADSGPRHIGNAAGVPVVFIRNTWFNPMEAGCYVDTETDLCPAPGRAGEGAELLAAIDPRHAAEVLAAIPS